MREPMYYRGWEIMVVEGCAWVARKNNIEYNGFIDAIMERIDMAEDGPILREKEEIRIHLEKGPREVIVYWPGGSRRFRFVMTSEAYESYIGTPGSRPVYPWIEWVGGESPTHQKRMRIDP